MKSFLTVLALVGMLAAPAASFAASYQYVSVQGALLSVTAANPDAAIAAAVDIAPHSGVILADQGGVQIAPSGTTYQYVTVNGTITSVSATSPDAALAAAISIAPHSGVMLVANSTVMIPTTNTVAV